MNKELVYLATPYSHSEIEVRNFRFNTVNQMAGKLMKDGFNVFSPISHTHVIAQAYELPHTWEFWREQDFSILRHCNRLIVLKLDGWDKSVGVTAEIEIAKELGIPIDYMEI